MIQLFLVLCGSRLIRRKWWLFFLVGLVWVLSGAFLFVDALDGSLIIPIAWFTVPLIFDGLWAVFSSPARTGAGKALRLVKGGTCLLVALLIFFTPRYSGVVVGLLVGVFLCLDASWRGVSAWVVRYGGWRTGLFFAVLEFLFGAWSFVPWPTAWEGEVGIDTGTLLLLSGASLCSLALRIRRLPLGVSVLSVLNAGEPAYAADAEETGSGEAPGETAIIHIWTPTESMIPVSQGVSRYVAAADKNGVVSAGHAALELPPDLYISHYPAVELERSGPEFAKALRATSENDVPGRFQPSYAEESAGWCASTVRVRLPGLNGRAVRRFWRAYSADTTYNLTNRNCARVVVKALDAGLDGIFAQKMRSPLFLLRFVLTPEFRVAGFMRRRAMAMAWTPGIAMDYVRALWHLVTVLGEVKDAGAGVPEGELPAGETA